MNAHFENRGLRAATARLFASRWNPLGLLLLVALVLNVGTPQRSEQAPPARTLEAFQLVDVRPVDIDTPRLALLLADGDKKLNRLLKRLGKTQNRVVEARIRQAVYQQQFAMFAADLTLANTLPETTPQEQKAKAKAIKKLTKSGKRANKNIQKWGKKITSSQTRVNSITTEIDKIDPGAAPPSHLLDVVPGALVFDTTVGSPAPDPQRISVENLGTVPMNWSAAADANWVDITPSSGTLEAGTSTNADVTVSASGLTTGSYSASISVNAPEASNVPPDLAVALSVVPPPVQNGLLGEYFDDIDLTDFVQTRFDANVDFTSWGNAPTGTAVTPDANHSERWTGFVSVPRAGSWTFSTLSNDGVRLWVDSTLIVDNWTSHSATEDEGIITLTAGWHAVRLEHYQSNGSVVIQLSFRGPNQKKVIIPSTAFTTALGGNQPPTVDGGPNQQLVLPASSAVLAATASDLDGFIDS